MSYVENSVLMGLRAYFYKPELQNVPTERAN